jgi:hypothetical protein
VWLVPPLVRTKMSDALKILAIRTAHDIALWSTYGSPLSRCWAFSTCM